MNSTALYSIPDEAQPHLASIHEPLRQYRDWQFDNRVVADLLEQIAYLRGHIEQLQYLRLELSNSLSDVHYIDHRLGELGQLLATVERRKRLLQRHQNDPMVPCWPKRAGRVGELALDLKRLWPLPRFCRELLLVDLQGRGDQLRARCPIPTHDDKSPSFVVFTASDRWRCFGACNIGGDVYDLIKCVYGHEDFRAQVRMLADATAINVDVA